MKHIFIVLVVLGVFMSKGPAWADNPRKPQVILQDIKSISLYLRIMPDDDLYRDAFECRTHPDNCGNRADVNHKEAFIKWMNEIYDAYPQALLPDKLTEKLVAVIQAKLKDMLPKTPEGEYPNINVMNDAPLRHCIDITTPQEKISCARKTVFDYANDVSNLTITVDVLVENDVDKHGNRFRTSPFDIYSKFDNVAHDIDPRIAHIRATLFRPNCRANYISNLTEMQNTISFNWGAEDIERHVNEYMESIGVWLQLLRENNQYVSGVNPYSCFSSVNK